MKFVGANDYSPSNLFRMSCPPAAQTTMDETGAGLEFSLKAAWNKRFRLYQRKLKLEL